MPLRRDGVTAECVLLPEVWLSCFHVVTPFSRGLFYGWRFCLYIGVMFVCAATSVHVAVRGLDALRLLFDTLNFDRLHLQDNRRRRGFGRGLA